MTGRPPEEEDGIVADGVDRMAHQLRNPLQAIAVNLEVLRLKAAGAVGPDERDEVERLAEVVNASVRTLDRRIALLVALARRSETEAPSSLRLGAFVREAVAAFQLDEREGGGDLQLELPAEERDPEVRARRGWLLALLLRAVASPGEGTGMPVLRVRSGPDRGGRLELAPLDPAAPGSGPAGDGDDVADLARRAGAEVGIDGDALVVRFPAA